MSSLGLKILCLIVSILYINGCSVGDIDLSFIPSGGVTCIFENNGNTYHLVYDPCGESLDCQPGSNYIAVQNEMERNKNQVKECWFLISNGDPPAISTDTFHGDKAYIAKYNQGQDARVTDIRFFCGDSDFDDTKTTCNEIPGSTPSEYYLELYTKNACDAAGDSSGLSAGWIFVIWYIILFMYIYIK